MVKLGEYNRLKVVKFVDFGVYLDGGESGEILLPARYVDDDTHIGDELNVFIYNDSEERLIATTERPYATVGTFAFLQVVDVNNVGAFLDWGLQYKNLLVPFSEQKVRMKQGGVYMVYIYVDHETKRIVASAKTERFIGNRFPELSRGDKVKALVYSHTDLGYKCVVDNLYHGMVFDNEVFRPVELGVEIEAYVKNVRDDGKIDLSLVGNTGERVGDLSDTILDALRLNNGRLEAGDKTDPERIKALFHCSKRDFKKALGKLYREKRITLGDGFIELARN